MPTTSKTAALSCAAIALVAGMALRSAPAQAEGSVVVYCGVNEEWCRAAASAFQEKTGIHVDMTRQSAGEIFARLRAEKENPRGDIWYGGTGDPHLQAAADGLTEPYKSPALGQLRDWAQDQAKRSGDRTVGLYLGVLGFGYNEQELKDRNLAAPACWSDLLKPEFEGEVQMADPNSSGTAWTMLATIVQLMGEDKAFEYLVGLNKNIDQYTSAGAAPAQAVGRGETIVGIAFQHDLINAAKQSPAVKVVSPCEGTGYEIGSMSLIKGARHMEEAKKFYDWALTPEAQAIAAKNGSFQVPSNTASAVPPESPDTSNIKLIHYDFEKYGSSAERTRLLSRWTKDVKNGG
ncbi:ABC transporter substrate-binding protein [Inquilinus limosus]|uniref:Iron ABC transporter substrate-binding protein n=1 Tax=Inquilinus limosus MP06 TaxID=1398085 RepID=A0A0A0D9M6_9PROT|nr:ABC transporter substrate-binding protein [Inquilinus limosus]KGM35401.1 iron ABC transporter substrate-binding protein [Inquilinus limosus MP06]